MKSIFIVHIALFSLVLIVVGCSKNNNNKNSNNTLDSNKIVKPIMAISKTTITFAMSQPGGTLGLLFPPACSQYFTLANIGPAGSILDFNITADDGPYVVFTNHTGSLGSMQSVEIKVDLDTASPFFKSGYFGGNMFLRIFDIHNMQKGLPELNEEIVFESKTNVLNTAILGIWSGTWSGKDNGRANAGQPAPTTNVGGNWNINIQSIDFVNNAFSGTLTWTGADAYWTYTYDVSGAITSATPKLFIADRTIVLNSTNTKLTFDPSSCNGVMLTINQLGTIADPVANYGPWLNVTLYIDSLTVRTYGNGFLTHPYNPVDTSTAGVSSGIITGKKN